MMKSYPNKYLALLNELKNRDTKDDLHPNSRVLIVDGLNTFIRSYAASPVTNEHGAHVGGISGTLLSIGHAIKSINPTRVVVVFDGKNGSAKRRQLFSEYKANRKVKIRLNRPETVDAEDSQLHQLMRLVEYLDILPVTTVVLDNAEADDIMAYMVESCFHKEGDQVYIMSSDKDFYQLVSDKVIVWSPTKKKLYFQQDVFDEYGIHPINFVTYRALLGDKSDNIGGVNGIGEKTIQSKFPILTENRKISVEELLEYAQTNAQGPKIYQTLLDHEDILKRNIQLMQLSESNLNLSIKMRVMELVDQPITKTAKLQFHKMLIEDSMTTAIKNVDMWLKDVTTKLDMFALQTQ